jgi:hypothetical protein
MKKNGLIVTMPILIISFLMPALGALQNSNISSHGTIEYASHFKMGIYTSSWNFGEYDAGTIANTFDMSQSWWVYDPTHPEWDYMSKMNQVHALNPNYKALVYRNVNTIYYYWPDEWNLANNNGWLLKDASGNYLTWGDDGNYDVDITNPDYQRWVAQKIKSWIDQYPFFDGVMVDNSLKYGVSETPMFGLINPRTKTYFTDQDIWIANAQLLNSIISAIGPSKMVLANGVWNGEAFFAGGYNTTMSQVPQLTALGSEGVFYQSYSGWYYDEKKWKQSLDMVVWIQENFLRGHPEKSFNGWVPVDDPSYLPPATTQEQLMMFGFCSMMLGVKYSEQNTISFGPIGNYPNLLSLTQRLHGLDIGEPLSNYYKINSTSLYSRDFAKGKVLVNPTGASYTVTLDASYTTFDGNIVSGPLTIGGHTGVILLK